MSKDKAEAIVKFLYIYKNALIILDKGYIIQYANKEARDIFPSLRENLSGQYYWEIISEFIENKNSEEYEAFKSGKGKTLEIYHRYKDKWYEMESDSLDDKGYFVKLVDITDKKLAVKALRESERKANELVAELRKTDEFKNTLISTLAHELRNPLATISMCVSLLEHADIESKVIEIRKIIERQTIQLTRLVDDILDTSRIIENRIEIAKEDIEINVIIKELIEDYKELFNQKSIELNGEFYKDPIYIHADPLRIKQVLGNLLMNSLKFTDNGGVVDLKVCKDQKDNNIIIEVTDTGRGIEQDLLEELFKPFVQQDNSFTRDTSGLGLGLSIAKGIVDLHNGSIEAISEGVGKGAKFVLSLPISGFIA